MLSTYGLQVLVPDHIRGRIFAVDFALITLSLGISSLAASAIADAAGPRQAAFALGGVAVLWAGVWWILTRKVRKGPALEGTGPDEDAYEPPEPDAVALGDR